MAGLVGGVVLPLLGAVPDGAIMLFSGLGDIESAQETLSVGVGALAGSTIMLLTIPWGLSVVAGRVDIDSHGNPNYNGKPKLTKGSVFAQRSSTGVSITDTVSHGAKIMMVTTIPYFLIQVPAFFIHGPSDVLAEGERLWALAGLVVCLVGFVSYLYMQVSISRAGEDKGKRVAVVKKLLQEGRVSLSGALTADVKSLEQKAQSGAYGSIHDDGAPDESVMAYLKEVLGEAFVKYDVNRNGTLDAKEVKTCEFPFSFALSATICISFRLHLMSLAQVLRDFHEDIADEQMNELMGRFDTNNDGFISYDEFIGACYVFINEHDTLSKMSLRKLKGGQRAQEEIASNILGEQGEDDEVEDIPEDFTDLSPEEQQTAIKKRAFAMLTIGTLLVILFSDPMVDVMQEIAERLGLSPFYVSFILAPLASNASEVIASQYYAAKKTRKTITVSLSALEGAASMNNTFCLSIFMGLIFFRGLAWQYTAETIAIVSVQLIIALMVQRKVMYLSHGFIILSIFPLSILFVATLEAFGLD